MFRRIRKLVGALLGGVTGAAVVAVAGAAGAEVPPELGAAVATLAGALGAWLAPPNEPAGPAQ